ncbi:MAG: hypothetical protein LC772_08860 [Chloroflexi bacterium]|nr:hypothetical protein [Chloroflexota bacterium]
MTGEPTRGRSVVRRAIRFRDVFLAGFVLLVCCGAVGLAAALLLHPSPGSTGQSAAAVRSSSAARSSRVQVRQILLGAAFGKPLTAKEKQTLQSLRQGETVPAVNRTPETHPGP